MKREDALNEIKRRISCADYLAKSKSYSSHNHTGYCCPACGSGDGPKGTGAVQYYPETNTWTCHACGAGHDVIDAYMAATGEDFNQALQTLAADLGIELDHRPTAAEDFFADADTDPLHGPVTEATGGPQSDFNSPDDKQPAEDNKNGERGAQAPVADFTEYYRTCRARLTDPAAVSYLQARGISPQTAAAFGLGYDPAADPASAPGALGDVDRPHPAPRIIVPCSRSHYVARSIDPATPASFKAVNPNTKKGGGSVALFNAAAIKSGAEIIFITEGWADALSFMEIGQQAIALNSKGNGKLLLKLLQQNQTAAAFIVVPDNDSDPKTAADTRKRAEDLNAGLLSMGLQSMVYNVAGDQHDANDLLKLDRGAFIAAAEAAIRELGRDDLDRFFEKITTEAYKPNRTELPFFDELLSGGIVPQSLLFLMAAPGAGKTTLAQQISEKLARNQTPVIYFNFEMSTEQMLAKAISARLQETTGISKSTTEILQGYKWANDEQTRPAIERVINDYRQNSYPFIRYNPANVSNDLDEILNYLNTVGAEARRKGQQAPAAVIDYLHLLTSTKGVDLQELIKQAVKGLKDYAKEYNTFVIAITASNRESNKKGRLTMESGRDSSSIEYTGDYVISLNYYEIDKYASNKNAPGAVNPNNVDAVARLQEQPRRIMILRVLKNRFGSPGRHQNVIFDTVNNIFYGTCDEFFTDSYEDYTDEPQTPERI